MTEEQINEIVQIDDAIRNCYLNAIERTDADREYRVGQRKIAKWLEELKRYKENGHCQKEHIKALISGQESLQELIAEKDAEIERLETDKIIAERKEKDARALFKDSVKQLKSAKSKAIKEVAERLEEVFSFFENYDTLHIYEIKDRIENLIEEMEGGESDA